MKNTLTIARNEFRRIFVSPLAWAVIAVVQLITGFIFVNMLSELAANPLSLNDYFGVSDYISAGVFGFATVLFLLIMPLMTMRMFAEERKTGSITLLFSSPASLTEIVMGKFLGLSGFLIIMLALLCVMPLCLGFGTDLDYGRIAAGALGLFLMMLAFASAGLFISTLTKEPTIAAICSFGVLLLVWLIDVLGYQDNIAAPVFQYLSLIGHYDSLRRGVFNTADVAYYVLFCSLFLWATVQRLDMERN